MFNILVFSTNFTTGYYCTYDDTIPTIPPPNEAFNVVTAALKA